jgi:hypothetical protein
MRERATEGWPEGRLGGSERVKEHRGSFSVCSEAGFDHGLLAWARMIPESWDWQKKSKNLESPLAEFLFLPCPIRPANAPVPSKSPPRPLCPLWLNKMPWGNIVKLFS